MDMKERIKALAKQKNITVNKLEKDLGFSQGYISKLDKSKPNSERIRRIADYFNVSVDYLMTGGTPGNPLLTTDNAMLGVKILTDENLMNALNKFYSLSVERQGDIIDMINMYYLKEHGGK